MPYSLPVGVCWVMRLSAKPKACIPLRSDNLLEFKQISLKKVVFWVKTCPTVHLLGYDGYEIFGEAQSVYTPQIWQFVGIQTDFVEKSGFLSQNMPYSPPVGVWWLWDFRRSPKRVFPSDLTICWNSSRFRWKKCFFESKHALQSTCWGMLVMRFSAKLKACISLRSEKTISSRFQENVVMG